MEKKKYPNLPYNFYKYVPNNLLFTFEQMVENELIRFTQPEALNDPYELLVQVDKIFDVDSALKKLNMNDPTFRQNYLKNIPEWHKDLFGEKISIEILNILKPTLEPLIKQFFKNFMLQFTNVFNETIPKSVNQALGILCLCDNVSNNSLWANYANNHNVFQIAFNAQHEWFQYKPIPNNAMQCIRKVQYLNKRPVIKDISKTSIEMITKIFFSKSIEWSYENEWRMIKPFKEAVKIKDPTEQYPHKLYMFNIPRECISGITFGLNMKKREKRRIIEKIENDRRYKNIFFMQARTSDRNYSIMPNIIKKEDVY